MPGTSPRRCLFYSIRTTQRCSGSIGFSHERFCQTQQQTGCTECRDRVSVDNWRSQARRRWAGAFGVYMLTIPFSILTIASGIAWLSATRRGRRWLARCLGLLTFIAVGFTGYAAATLAIQGHIVSENYKDDFMEFSMARMQALAESGNIGAVTNAIAVYNQTLAQPHHDPHRAAWEMLSALKK